MPRLVQAACICARAVLPQVPLKEKQACINAIEAAEAWAAEPSDANRLRAEKVGETYLYSLLGVLLGFLFGVLFMPREMGTFVEVKVTLLLRLIAPTNFSQTPTFRC